MTFSFRSLHLCATRRSNLLKNKLNQREDCLNIRLIITLKVTYVFRARRKYFKRLGKGAIVLKLNKALREFTHFDIGIIYNHFTFIIGGETHDLTGYTS